jgi:hypothetical protein
MYRDDVAAPPSARASPSVKRIANEEPAAVAAADAADPSPARRATPTRATTQASHVERRMALPRANEMMGVNTMAVWAMKETRMASV